MQSGTGAILRIKTNRYVPVRRYQPEEHDILGKGQKHLAVERHKAEPFPI